MLDPNYTPPKKEPPIEKQALPATKSPYSRPPLTRNQIFLKLDKLKFRSDELAHFMGNKGMSREEYCIAVPMLFSIYEGTNEYKKSKEFRDKTLEQKKVSEEIVAGYTAAFKKQKELDEVLEKAKEKAIQSQEALYEKIKDQLMLEPNNEDIKKMIRDIIALEKQHNIYDEEYWEDILHLL